MWILVQYERYSKAAAELVSYTLTLLLPAVTIHTAECLRMCLVGWGQINYPEKIKTLIILIKDDD